jgi:hypothetical protein
MNEGVEAVDDDVARPKLKAALARVSSKKPARPVVPKLGYLLELR